MQKAHAEKIKEQTLLVWKYCGEYVLSAVFTAIDHNIHEHAKSNYVKMPEFEEQKQKSDEERATLEKLNFEIRGKMLEKMGLPMPPS